MHTNSVFNEPGLVVKLATSSRTSHKETPRRNKIGRWKVCKGLWSLYDNVIKLLNRKPLFYLSYNPVSQQTPWDQLKGKPIKTITFYWASRLIWMMMLYDYSSEMLHLIIVAWWRLTNFSPIKHYEIDSLSHIFTCPLTPNRQQASSILYSQDSYLELAFLNVEDEHHLISFSHRLYQI
jgi:hypothetical protein